MTQPTLHDLIDGLDVLICGLDEHGKIHVFNRPCERLTGLPREKAMGQSWLDMFAIGERSDHVVSLWRQAREDSPAGPYEAPFRNGRNVRWQFSRWERGRVPPIALWAVGVDVTHEREALVRERELARMVALSNLVSGLTHELRNPLNSALLQLALADRNLARRNDANAGPAVEAIVQASAEMRRISNLLDDFLVFVRPQPGHLERTDVRRIVARAIERSGAKAQAGGVSVTLEPGAEALAGVDVSRVESAVYHLIANAIDAASEAADRGVQVTVGASGNMVVIEVEDHGAGLPSADTPIFEPFFTTKRGGTGLGLAIVERVATDHGGAITYERRDRATVFRLELPIIGGVGN
jgi:PAS domain S-box-containing protein